MKLSGKQKKTIRKLAKAQNVVEIAKILNLELSEVVGFLKKEGVENTEEVKIENTGFVRFVRKYWKGVLFIAFLVIVSYANSLNNDFLSDDLDGIVNNRNIGILSEVMAHPFSIARPAVYFVIFHLAEFTPAAFRGGNILFHLGSAELLYFFVSTIANPILGILTAGIFAVHPILVESVSWVSGGSYAQYSFFFLLAFYWYQKSDKFGYKLLLSIAMSIVAFTTLPQAVAFPALLTAYELSFGNIRKRWKLLLPFWILGGVFALNALGLVGSRSATLTKDYNSEGGEATIPFTQVPISVTEYIRLFLLPIDLTLYHSEMHFSTLSYITRLVLTIGLILLTVLSYFKRKELFLCLAIFLISIFPSMLSIRLSWVVAERYVYFGAIGLSILVAFVIEKLVRNKSLPFIGWGVFVCLITILSVRTIARNVDWKNQDNLWTATAVYSPSSPNNHNNMGDVYTRHKDFVSAAKEFEMAVKIKPNYADAYHNLGNANYQLGDLEKAVENYKMAVYYRPHLLQSYVNMAIIYDKLGKRNEAIETVNKALEYSPGNKNLLDYLEMLKKAV